MMRKTLTLRKDPSILRGQLRTWFDFNDMVRDSESRLLDLDLHYALLARLVVGQTIADKYFSDGVALKIAEARLIIRSRIRSCLGTPRYSLTGRLSPAEKMIIHDALYLVDEMVGSTTGLERSALADLSKVAMQDEFNELKSQR